MGEGNLSGDTRPERWRPNRVGIRNIWEYDDQEFHFVDGRLILRGPNGSGKSNALALLVPFVFDAIMSSGRMDPFGGGRSMKTLLLSEQREEGTGSRFRRDQRTGYVWMELSKGDRFLTIGCGARASVQRDAEAWFFVTQRRPGKDLDLVPGGTPMTRAQLVEALGAGAVYETAESYRDAVDGALFGVGTERYRHLVDLLLVLRRPHLAGKLHPEELSAVLTQGLPPVPDTLVGEVAASFEDLEAVRNDLARLREATQAVDDFCPVYRSYLRTVSRSRAEALLDAVLSSRRARSRLAQSHQALEQAVADLDESERARDEAGRLLTQTEERLRAVLESPAFRHAAALITLAEQASDARKQAAQASRLVEEATQARNAAAERVRTGNPRAARRRGRGRPPVQRHGPCGRRSRRVVVIPPRRAPPCRPGYRPQVAGDVPLGRDQPGPTGHRIVTGRNRAGRRRRGPSRYVRAGGGGGLVPAPLGGTRARRNGCHTGHRSPGVVRVDGVADARRTAALGGGRRWW